MVGLVGQLGVAVVRDNCEMGVMEADAIHDAFLWVNKVTSPKRCKSLTGDELNKQGLH